MGSCPASAACELGGLRKAASPLWAAVYYCVKIGTVVTSLGAAFVTFEPDERRCCVTSHRPREAVL